VCLIAPGEMSQTRLVPPEVMPTRELQHEAMIKLVDGKWQSSEGKMAEDRYSDKDTYPQLADVLPCVGKTPFYLTPKQGTKPPKTNGRVAEPHVVLAINVDLLRKVADSLGDSKLVLFVPVPIKQSPDAKASDMYVTKPVPICTADIEDKDAGIGVVMPLKPEKAAFRYEHMRKIVAESENNAKTNGRG